MSNRHISNNVNGINPSTVVASGMMQNWGTGFSGGITGVMPPIGPFVSGSVGSTQSPTTNKSSMSKTAKTTKRVTINSDALIEKLGFYFDQGLNVHLSGKRGIGKTAIITEVLNKKSAKWLYFSAATLDPFTDFVGVPKEVVGENGKSTLTFVRPEYMTDDVEVIFLDEYNRAAKKVRNATMELIQFKSINGQKFPKLRCVWIGTNPWNPDADDAYDVEPLDPAQSDRFQIQIELPYVLDETYFTRKYGSTWAEGACEWWWGLPEEIREIISPRRVDYALELKKLGGDIHDIIPREGNPSKLIASLNHGGVEKKIMDYFTRNDVQSAQNFFTDENNYQASIPYITKSADTLKFFYPALDSEERAMSLFVGNEEFQKLVFSDSMNYRDLLKLISENKTCDKDLLKKVNHELEKLKGIELDNLSKIDGNNNTPFSMDKFWGKKVAKKLVDAPLATFTSEDPTIDWSYVNDNGTTEAVPNTTLIPTTSNSKDKADKKTIWEGFKKLTTLAGNNQ